ncbi:5-oxoprolinase subunit B family protein [Nocardioides stalactiti]|uniref:5-oxoprolinase subunit B family protein n=1 Tax=Nocardioides stalactiti TaxID=2755356 RepID=UPI00160200F7|nr:allophanate hydrolase subunit 1 [Nocardioides stalactiti]
MSPQVLPYGDRALLLELPDTAAVVAYVDALAAAPGFADLVDDVVPGARTVLVRARRGVDLAQLETRCRAEIAIVPPEEHPLGPDVGALPGGPSRVEIPVEYDGPDLGEVARLTGLTRDEVVEAHTGTPWRVAFGGFAPGFAYLVGGDPRLHVPRRATPRTAVPAGAVGLAGEFSGVYPRESPGGWQLIGTTAERMWDLDRDQPALLAAGATVRFVRA